MVRLESGCFPLLHGLYNEKLLRCAPIFQKEQVCYFTESNKVMLMELAHRQSLRHISVRVSDILCVGGGKDYGLELSVSPLPRFSI